MKNMLFLLMMVLTFACRKGDDIQLVSPKGVEFFSSKTSMSEAVKAAIGNDYGKLKTFAIRKVSYFEDKVKSLGLITYEANGQEHTNILFAVSAEVSKTYKCTASDCNCRIDVYPDESGGYVYECGGCNTNCHWEVTAN